MLIIDTMKGIRQLHQDNSLDHQLLIYLGKAFRRLHQALDIGVPEAFSLNPYGPFVILESHNNLHGLRELGLGSAYDSLFGAIPEFVAQMSTVVKSSTESI